MIKKVKQKILNCFFSPIGTEWNLHFNQKDYIWKNTSEKLIDMARGFIVSQFNEKHLLKHIVR